MAVPAGFYALSLSMKSLSVNSLVWDKDKALQFPTFSTSWIVQVVGKPISQKVLAGFKTGYSWERDLNTTS